MSVIEELTNCCENLEDNDVEHMSFIYIPILGNSID